MVAMNELISVHAPSIQACPGAHATPQLPQLRNDARKSTHPEPHWMKLPQLSRHVPWVHCRPPAHARPAGATVVLVAADIRGATRAVLDDTTRDEADTFSVLADRVGGAGQARGPAVERTRLEVVAHAVYDLVADRAIRWETAGSGVAHLTRLAGRAASTTLAERYAGTATVGGAQQVGRGTVGIAGATDAILRRGAGVTASATVVLVAGEG